jgi:hypothetical protein
MGAAGTGGVLKCGRDDRLEVELQPVLNLCGDSLKIFCIWYSATTPAAADDYLSLMNKPEFSVGADTSDAVGVRVGGQR